MKSSWTCSDSGGYSAELLILDFLSDFNICACHPPALLSVRIITYWRSGQGLQALIPTFTVCYNVFSMKMK